MGFEASKYKFNQAALQTSAGQFGEFLKERYPKLTKKQVSELVEREYGKDEPLADEKATDTNEPPKEVSGE